MASRPASLLLQSISSGGSVYPLTRTLPVRVVIERDGFLCYDEEVGAEGVGDGLDEAFTEYQDSFASLCRRLLHPAAPLSAEEQLRADRLRDLLASARMPAR